MGNKQTTIGSSGFNKSLSNINDSNNITEDYESKLKVKRRFSNKNHLINRSSSSPLIAKCRFSNYDCENLNKLSNETNQSEIKNSNSSATRTIRSPLSNSNNNTNPQIITPRLNTNSSIINLNNELKQKQQDLTTAIKRIDSTQSNNHLNSKLYKPNSFLLATKLSNKHELLPNKFDTKTFKNLNYDNNHANTLPLPGKNFDQDETLSPKNVRISPKVVLNDSQNSSNKSKPTSKIAKRFGLSPRFKRKIVETITNRVNSNPSGSNQKFGQSRLFQALQSQWNLFTGMSLSRNNLNKSDFEDDDDENYSKNSNPFQRKRKYDTTSTFLSTSVERNSFRYASRRKYKTQSLANPFRHADTNYTVYIHEALFMPEFSVKGHVTEADFEILDVISRGAFGHVIKVKKKSNQLDDKSSLDTSYDDNQIYAMKIMWKSQVIRDRALQQVKDEVTIATSCVDNPLIVKTWFYWQSKRFLYIITDFVENGELLSLWLKVHRFPERMVALYAVEMCLALDYLHKRGIIYRDIKMENILLDQRGHIQLIDFGLSKWLKMGDKTCTICGTIQYMAPEILSVEPYDHSVDWWSLGILIYALLSGEYPLNAAKDHIQMNEKVAKHVFELDQSTGKYSLEACDLVRKLLRKNPHRRLKSLAEIKQDGFFIKELNTFINNYALEHGKSREEISLLANDNYWNPYFIIQNYSPLQLLFDEIYAIKKKNKLEKVVKPKSRLNLVNNNNIDSRDEKMTIVRPVVEQTSKTETSTNKNINSSLCSSLTSTSTNCSETATRTTISIPNTSTSDELIENTNEESNESTCFKPKKKHNNNNGNSQARLEDIGDYGDDENDDYEDNDDDDDEGENEYYRYEEDENDIEIVDKNHAFTKF